MKLEDKLTVQTYNTNKAIQNLTNTTTIFKRKGIKTDTKDNTEESKVEENKEEDKVKKDKVKDETGIKEYELSDIISLPTCLCGLYYVIPWDLISDLIPFIGKIDDFFITFMILNFIYKRKIEREIGFKFSKVWLLENYQIFLIFIEHVLTSIMQAVINLGDMSRAFTPLLAAIDVYILINTMYNTVLSYYEKSVKLNLSEHQESRECLQLEYLEKEHLDQEYLEQEHLDREYLDQEYRLFYETLKHSDSLLNYQIQPSECYSIPMISLYTGIDTVNDIVS